MTKPYTFFRLALPLLALVVIPSLLHANSEPNGNPPNGGPASPDSIATALKLGHCGPIIQSVVNCQNHTIELSAWVEYLFSGQVIPYVATWNTGETAHKIIVTPPGAWSWDYSTVGCDHFLEEYVATGPFFNGPLVITGPIYICPNSGNNALNIINPNALVFNDIQWVFEHTNGQNFNIPTSTPTLPIDEPGVYTLSLKDEYSCPFTSSPFEVQDAATSAGFTYSISNHTVTFTNQSTTASLGFSGWEWTFGDGQTSQSANPTITFANAGVYNVCLTAFNPVCSSSICQDINIPNTSPWTVTPTSRNHTIIIPDTLKTDLLGGNLQIGDQIGVFYDSSGTLKCGGYGVWSGLTLVFAAYGNDAAPLPPNGFNTGEVFKIKYWRASTGEIFDASVQYAPVGWLAGLITHTNAFADDGISMMNALTTKASHAIALNNGWNMISSYVVPTNPNMKDVFDPIASSVDLVKDGAGDSYIPLLMINGIGDWNLQEGYQVKANQKDTLVVTGQKAIPEANPMLLKTGWQIIGYLRDSPMNIDTVFKSIKTQINLVKNNDGKIYSPQFGINTIGNMIPGQGYKVKALSNVTLSYRPNFTGNPVAERAENAGETETLHFILDSNLNTGNNAVIILMDSIADNVIDSGDEIGVFTSTGVLCGTAKYHQGENLAITVWGDDPSTPAIFEGLKVDSAYNFIVWDSSDQKACMAITSFQSGINAYAPDAIEVIQDIMLGVPTDTIFTAVACNSYILNNQTFTSSGVYTQTLTNVAGCDSTITLHLTIYPAPTVTSDSQTICFGQTATLTANGAENYLWSTGATTDAITVIPYTTTTYTVTGTTANCSASVAGTVTVNPLPTVDLGVNISLPAGDTAVLDATCACQSYLWSTGETTATIGVHSLGTYAVTVSTTAGCTATDNIVIMTTSTNEASKRYTISVSPNPTDDLLFIICHGSSSSRVQVIDHLGKVILEDKDSVPDGISRTISLKKMPSGSYYVQIVGEGFTKTVSVIKH